MKINNCIVVFIALSIPLSGQVHSFSLVSKFHDNISFFSSSFYSYQSALGLDDPPKVIAPAQQSAHKEKLDFSSKVNNKFSSLAQSSSWDIDKSLKFLRANAAPSSLGKCAKYVRLALASGGVKIQAVPSAKMLGKSLIDAGFIEIAITDPPMPGDIVVIEPYPGGEHGHSAMFDGEIWISDFKQNSMYPGASYKASQPIYRFYRKR